MSDSVLETDKLGNKIWKNSKGQLHRTDGPAIDWINGGKEWFQNGNPHRLNGPAFEWASGDKSWWVNGEYLGLNDKGFWGLWDRLTTKQKKDPALLSYLPGDFNV